MVYAFQVYGNYSPFHTIIKNLMLLSVHRKHAVKSETILLWPHAQLSRPQLHSPQVLIERYNNIPSFPLL